MKVTRLGVLLSLPILLSTVVTQAQTASSVQGYPQIGPPTVSYSALYLDASQFCAQGFNFALHGCNPVGSTGMWEAIAAAIASSNNISGVIDARAFQGPQRVTFGIGTTALYGCLPNGTGQTSCAVGGNTNVQVGDQVTGALLLGQVTNDCDGPSNSDPPYYTDGNGSNYGTPCVIVPWGFQIIGTAPIPYPYTPPPPAGLTSAVTFAPCIAGSPAPCQNPFPHRSFSISQIAVSGTTMTVTVPGTQPLTVGGGPKNGQNIYPVVPPNPTDTGELVAITGAPPGDNVLRTVQTANAYPANTFTVSIPNNSGTSCAPCTGSPTAYLVTPLIGFGYQNNASDSCAGTGTPTCAYEPVRVGENQSFGSRVISLTFDLQSALGAVAVQNLNGGEQSGMDTIYCKHPSMGCVQVGSGASESGPYSNIYEQTLGVTNNVFQSTFGIYNGSAGAGFHRFTMTVSTGGIQPTAAIYDDGPNVVFDGEPHNEGTVDTIDVAPDTSVAGLTINGIAGPPCTNAGTNLVHILADGYTVNGSTISALTQQPQVGSCSGAGSVNAVADDVHTNYVKDAYLSRYEFDAGGAPISGADSQTNNPGSSGSPTIGISILNGSGLSAATGAFTNTSNQLVLGSSPNLTTLNFPAPSGAVTLNFPNVSGTIVGNAFPMVVSGTTPVGHFPSFTSTPTLASDSNLDDGSTATNTLTYSGSGGITASNGPITAASPSSGNAGMMVWAGNTGNPTCPTSGFCIFGFSTTSGTAYGWQPSSTPPTPALSTQFMQITAPSSGTVYPISYISTVPISEGGTNATTAATGQIPNSSTGTTSSWTNTPTLGVQGTAPGSLTLAGGSASPGSLAFGSTTTGQITLQPVTGALGTPTISLPAAAGTVAVSATLPITESTGGAVACPTCVISTSSLTDTAIMTGAGGAQGSQTPSTGATLNSSGSMSLPGTITSGSNGGTGGSLTLNGSSSGSATVTASSAGNLQLNNTSTFVDTNGSLTIGRHLNQNAANTFAGSCTMSGVSTCTFSITASFTNPPLTFVSQDASATVAQIAAKCSVSSTTVTITAAAINSSKWDCLIVGNPN